MKTVKYIIATLTAVSLLGCTRDEQQLTYSYDNDPDAVVVTASVASTKVNTEAAGDTFTEGDSFMVENIAEGINEYRSKAKYQYSGGAWKLVGEQYMHWADGYNYFQAWMPAGAAYGSFVIPADQSSVAGLRSANWMTAAVNGVEKTENRTLNLEFSHKLAKVVVTVTEFKAPYTGEDAITNAKFTVAGKGVSGEISIADSSNEIAAYISDKSMSAVLAPGTYEAGKTFLSLNVGSNALAVEVSQSGITLESGKSYKFTLTVENNRPRISSVTVNDWNEAVLEGVMAEEDKQKQLEREALIALYNATNGDNWTNNENWCSDKPVGEWYGIRTYNNGLIEILSLSGNNLCGEIPESIDKLSNLYSLYLGGNNLSGLIPESIGNIKTLNTIELVSNNLTGSIPNTIGNLKNLQYLYLNSNNLTGIPESICDLTQLREVNLSWNNLSGELPENIGNLVQLRTLYLNNNNLSGEIPKSIGELKKLEVLSMEFNQLSGSIPETIGDLVNLSHHLRLDNNQLTGIVPKSIGNLRKLLCFDVSLNQVSGSIPESIGDMESLENCNFYSNSLTGPIPNSIGNLKNLKMLSFCKNRLSGSIPESIGEMTSLVELYLNNGNSFSGEIPRSIEKLINLKVISLCGTGLHGDIPQWLVDLPIWRLSWPGFLNSNYFCTRDLYIPAPKFSNVKTIDGTILTDAVFQENELTILFNWRSGCSDTKLFLPTLKAIYEKYKDKGLGIISFSTDESDEAVREFINGNSISWTTFNDNIDLYNTIDDFVLPPQWFPGVYVVDKSGRIVFNYIVDNYLDLEKFIAKNLDNAESDLYKSHDYSTDRNVITLQEAKLGNGIDVVLMGDAYSDRLIADGTYLSVMEASMERLFSEEPYKSYRDYFNVYMVNVVSENEVYDTYSTTTLETWFGEGTEVGGNMIKVVSYALEVISAERLDEALIVVMMNRDYYAGTCYMYYPSSGNYGNGTSVAYFPTSSDEATFNGLMLHEAGGHGFAKLDDEYAYEEYGQVTDSWIEDRQNMVSHGWWKNIDFTNDVNIVKWAHFLADERYQYDGLGVFEGASTYWTGAWRPTENSIMRHNTGGFNAPSREAIYTRIHKLAYGEDWEYNYEDFVAYDEINRKTAEEAAAAAARPQNIAPWRPTTPPVVVGKTWREAMEDAK